MMPHEGPTYLFVPGDRPDRSTVAPEPPAAEPVPAEPFVPADPPVPAPRSAAATPPEGLVGPPARLTSHAARATTTTRTASAARRRRRTRAEARRRPARDGACAARRGPGSRVPITGRQSGARRGRRRLGGSSRPAGHGAAGAPPRGQAAPGPPPGRGPGAPPPVHLVARAPSRDWNGRKDQFPCCAGT